MASSLHRLIPTCKIFCLIFIIYGIFSFRIYSENGRSTNSERGNEAPERNLTLSKTERTRKINFKLEKRTFPKNPECRNFTTKLYVRRTFNLTALVSYPGSGNTWLRHLIEIGTGAFTGSVYFDTTLFSQGFLGEREDWSSGSTIVQKLHLKYNGKYGFNKAVLLIREPISAIHSFVQYLESGHIGWASPSTFRKKEWPKYVLHCTYDWITLAKSWLESSIEVLVIHYENLREAPAKEVYKICNFLKVDCSRMEIDCFQNNTEGSFHRKKAYWKTKTFLMPDVQNKIDDGIDYLNRILLKYGHESLPLVKYRYYKNSSIDFF